MKNLNWVLAGLLIFVAIGVSVFVVYTTTTRTLTAVEGTLWQIFVLAAGLAGSFIFGQQSAKINKLHARSAFRNLLSLYQSLRLAATQIKTARSSESHEDTQVILARVDATITSQIMTADNALEDWRDIVPEDVEELEHRLSSDIQQGVDND